MIKKPYVSKSKTRTKYNQHDLLKTFRAHCLKSKTGLSQLGESCVSPKTQSKKKDSNLWELSPDRLTNVITELSSTYQSTHSNIRSRDDNKNKTQFKSKAKAKAKCLSPSSLLSSSKGKQNNFEHFFQSKIPLSKLIEEIKEKVVDPMRTQIRYNTKRTRNMNQAVEEMKTHVSSMSEDLSKSIGNSRTFMKSCALLSCDIEENQIENDDIEREVKELKRENEELLNERFITERETLMLSNEYNEMKNDVDGMRNQSILVAKVCEDIQTDKKVQISSLLFVMKKIMRLKEIIYYYQKNHDNATEELLMLIN